ncbi:MAG: hypothetical protein HN352_14965 [Bacteroidetes bacterium]|nr:hypothetical protein [Bacteroidota bacterium]MBT3750000.1 hypothetical protein [Bacteroidota bacterium]MBT7093210.1 hypothetical protein [Bacteroidota bacterium]
MYYRFIVFLFLTCLVHGYNSEQSSSSVGAEPIIIPIDGVDFDVIPAEIFLNATEFVFVETNKKCFIDVMSSYHMANNQLFVYNTYQSERVKRFYADGKFLNKKHMFFTAIVQGPGSSTENDLKIFHLLYNG